MSPVCDQDQAQCQCVVGNFAAQGEQQKQCESQFILAILVHLTSMSSVQEVGAGSIYAVAHNPAILCSKEIKWGTYRYSDLFFQSLNKN